MPELRKVIHLFLLTADNAFQIEQARAAEAAARRLGVDLVVRYAENNTLVQIDQAFSSIHAKNGPAPDAVIVEPVAGEGLPRVARNAVRSGIGWAVLNSDAPYMAEIRRESPEVPAVAVSVDNLKIGELQAAQLLRLLSGREPATALCVQGPPAATPARRRAQGLDAALAGHRVERTRLDARWTVDSAREVVSHWVQLRGQANVDAVLAQNDEMAEGARQAIAERLGESVAARVRFLGCDGLKSYGQALIRAGHLAATLATELPAQRAVELLGAALAGGPMPPEEVLLPPSSTPPLDALTP
jgi:ABC-type sugar transport system substrate-binding protein